MFGRDLAKWYAALVGVILVAIGALGFINNPLVGEPGSMFVTGTVHNIVHLATGVLALYIAFGLRGTQQALGVSAFGVLYGVVFVLLAISPTLFGILGNDTYTVNAADQALHAGLAIISLLVGGYAMRRQGMAV